jgi:tryptophan-rich sensory protein
MSATARSSRGSVATNLDAPVRRRAHDRWRSAALLAAALAATATVAAVGGVLVLFARDVWFDNLQRPAWVPAAWVFLVGGAVAYLAVGIAGWRIWVRAPGSLAFSLWAVQLGLHLGWTVLFFGLWVPRWAFAEAVVLAVVATATAVAAWPATRLGAALLVPYLGSIGFLLAVNAVIVAWN